MNHQKINSIEQKMRVSGLNGHFQNDPFSIPIKNEDKLRLEGFTCRPTKHSATYFYPENFPKKKIVLHFTVGNIQGDLGALTRANNHVSVPFLIARDGTIYQLFSSAAWSYHLGRGAVGGNRTQSRQSIGIELSNYGYLIERDGNLETAYSRVNGNPVDIYCSLSETDKYTKLDPPFREQSYYATFTDEQYESLIILLRYLTAQYNIPRTFLPEDIRYATTNKVASFQGITSHVNFRKSGKWDIGPAFDWSRIISGVQAEKYQALGKLERQLAAAQQRKDAAEKALKKAQEELTTAEQEIEHITAQIQSNDKSEFSIDGTLERTISLNGTFESEEGISQSLDDMLRTSDMKNWGEEGPPEREEMEE